MRLPVRGTSMLPTLAEGDRVEVRRCTPDRVCPGDVAAFSRSGELTVHRVLLAERTRFLEMGDGQERGNWHPWPAALGVVVAVERPSGVREDLSGGEAQTRAGALARRMLRRHRASALAESIPGAFCRRVARRLLRPWLRPPKENAEF